MTTLLVIGTGLIGGSLAMAARQSGRYSQVHAINRSAATNERVLALGVADTAGLYSDLPDRVATLKANDIVVAAVPVRAYQQVFSLLKDDLPKGVVVTDVGSAKAVVMDAARQVWGELPESFVPGHPIAGSEKSGVEAVNPALFQQRRCILTPGDSASSEAIHVVTELWETVGSEVDIMDPLHHDEVLGATSHLPHVLAYAIVDALYTLEQKSEIFRYAAGGFRDFTRIAESDPVMWRDIFLSNREAILSQLDNFESHLSDLRSAINNADSSELEIILERSQGARKLFSDIHNKR